MIHVSFSPKFKGNDYMDGIYRKLDSILQSHTTANVCQYRMGLMRWDAPCQNPMRFKEMSPNTLNVFFLLNVHTNSMQLDSGQLIEYAYK